MREYIRKSSGLDRSLTRRLKAVIGDYDRLKKRISSMAAARGRMGRRAETV
mgnify:CR=1 FL=1